MTILRKKKLYWYVCDSTKFGALHKMVTVCCFHSLKLELDSTAVSQLLWMHQSSCPWHPVSSLTLHHIDSERGNAICSTHLHCSIPCVMFNRCSAHKQALNNQPWTKQPTQLWLYSHPLPQLCHSPPFLLVHMPHGGWRTAAFLYLPSLSPISFTSTTLLHHCLDS